LARFLAAVCQLTAGSDPREAVLRAAKPGARLVVLPAFALGAWGDWTPGPGPGRAELLTRAIAIAREAGCYLIPGTVLVTEDEVGSGNGQPVVRQVAWLLGPDGELLGEQWQTHTSQAEEDAGWGVGSEVKVIQAPGLGCSVGLLVGSDAWVPEVSRILALGGADLLVAPLAMPRPYSEACQLAALWREVQQNQTIGIEACLVGERGGRSWAGRSAILAPCEMTPDESGFIARGATAARGLILFGPVDLDQRRAVVEAYDILAEMNTDIYRQAFPGVYFGGGHPAVIGADPAPVQTPPPPRLALRERAFRRYLTLASRPGAIRAAVRSLGIQPRTAAGGSRGLVRAAALQLESFYARSPAEYALRLGERFAEAVNQGAELVAFPEFTTLPLIGLLPGVAEMARGKAAATASPVSTGPATASPASTRPAAGPGAPSLPRLADIVSFMEPVLRRVYFTLFSALAAAARVWIMAGSTPLPGPDGKVYNVAALFDPDGNLVGTQSKLHLFPRERAEGLVPGTRFEVFDTSVGRLALPICMDATYFETYRLAALLGAQIVAAPVSNVEPYHYWKLLRGAWPRVQETPVYAIQSTIVGDFLGDPMTGKASIYAPAELTPAGDGILAQCPAPVGPGMAVADLDLKALAAFRAEGSLLSRLNPEIVRRYLPAIYEGRGSTREVRP